MAQPRSSGVNIQLRAAAQPLPRVTHLVRRVAFKSCSNKCASLLAEYQAETDGIPLNCSNKVIEFFARWLSSGNMDFCPPNPDGVEVYVFAREYKITELIRPILSKFYRLVQTHDRVPDAALVEDLWQTGQDSPLFRLFFNAYCLLWQPDEDWDHGSNLPHEFVNSIQLYRREKAGTAVQFDLCDYHEELHSALGRLICRQNFIVWCPSVPNPIPDEDMPYTGQIAAAAQPNQFAPTSQQAPGVAHGLRQFDPKALPFQPGGERGGGLGNNGGSQPHDGNGVEGLGQQPNGSHSIGGLVQQPHGVFSSGGPVQEPYSYYSSSGPVQQPHNFNGDGDPVQYAQQSVQNYAPQQQFDPNSYPTASPYDPQSGTHSSSNNA
ncbi:hypothetical protein BU16DRAFT_565643 [Lophium mytilinum]|uniref:BTB domain-containing protein n=1 Tax=Lophium mytilinum TaxID=390894 RepID=A0A6A6QE89_9PEZI|nr:hypothetical protein BU16DRAFT_565643 [Lophium mytilinum]